MGPAAFSITSYAATVLLVTAVFGYLHRLKRREYVLWWMWAWVFEFVRVVAELGYELRGTSEIISDLAFPLIATSIIVVSVLFLVGTFRLSGGIPPWTPLGVVLGVTVLWALVAPLYVPVSFCVTPVFLLAGGMNFWIGITLLRFHAKHPVHGGRWLGVLFFLWGLHRMEYPLWRFSLKQHEIWGGFWPGWFGLSSLLVAATAIFMLIYALEETGWTLQKAEERFRHLFSEAAECIMVCEPETGRILDANRKAQDLSGYSLDELHQTTLADLLIDRSAGTPESPSTHWIPSGDWPRSAVLEMDLRHREGQVIPISFTRTLIDEDSDRSLVLLHLRDDTESRRSRQDLQVQFDRLRALNQISQELSKSLDLARIYQIVFDQVRLIFPLDAFSVDLFLPEENALRTVFAAHRSGHAFHIATPGTKQKVSRTLFETVIRDRQPILENRPESFGSASWPTGTEIIPLSAPAGSRMFVPLVSSDEVLGLVSIQSLSTGAYDSSMLDLLQNIANLTATALGNSTLFQREHDYGDKMRFLKDLATALGSSLQVPAILETSQSMIAEFLHVDRAVVHLYDSEAGTLLPAEALRHSPRQRQAKAKDLSEEIPAPTASCFATNQPIVENDCQQSPHLSRLVVGRSALRSTMAVPISFRGRPTGVLRVDDCRISDRFQRADVDFVLLAAKAIAVAIENAQVYENLKASESRLTALVESAPQGVALLEDGQILYANQTLCSLLGRTKDDLLRRGLPDLVHADDLPALQNQLAEIHRHGHLRWGQLSLRGADGLLPGCAVEIRPLPGSDEARLLILFTQPNRTPEGPATPEPDLYLHPMGTLLSGIAGEFSALFSAILGHASYLKLILDPQSPAFRSLEVIEETSLRASEYLKRILSLPLLDGLELVSVDLVSLLGSILHDHQALQGNQRSFVLNTSPGLPSIVTHPALLRMALEGILFAADQVVPGEAPVRVCLEPLDPGRMGSEIRTEPGTGGLVQVRLESADGGMSAKDLAPLAGSLPAGGRDPYPPLGLSLSLGILQALGAAVTIGEDSHGQAGIDIRVPVTPKRARTTEGEPRHALDSPLPARTSSVPDSGSGGNVVVSRE